MTEVHWHLGAHKTGTTSLQNMIREMPGLLNVEHCITKGTYEYDLIDDVAYGRRRADLTALQLEETLREYQSVFISIENSSGVLGSYSSQMRLIFFFNTLLKCRHLSFTFYYMEREADGYCRSIWNELLRSGSFVDFRSFRNHFRSSQDFSAEIRFDGLECNHNQGCVYWDHNIFNKFCILSFLSKVGCVLNKAEMIKGETLGHHYMKLFGSLIKDENVFGEMISKKHDRSSSQIRLDKKVVTFFSIFPQFRPIDFVGNRFLKMGLNFTVGQPLTTKITWIIQRFLRLKSEYFVRIKN